jgi:hypothetical protein
MREECTKGSPLASDESGQMAAELAVLVPVALVVALVVLNLMRFVGACAVFDRASLDAIVSHGVAPAGEQTSLAAVDEVEGCIGEALDDESCEVEVSAENLSGDEAGVFSLASHLTRYTCTLVYRPWPTSLRLPGITYQAPLSLRHERTLVVDRYRPGVVL